jgi:hypothetical protein
MPPGTILSTSIIMFASAKLVTYTPLFMRVTSPRLAAFRSSRYFLPWFVFGLIKQSAMPMNINYSANILLFLKYAVVLR